MQITYSSHHAKISCVILDLLDASAAVLAECACTRMQAMDAYEHAIKLEPSDLALQEARHKAQVQPAVASHGAQKAARTAKRTVPGGKAVALSFAGDDEEDEQ